MARQQEVSASVREAQERRRAREQERLAQLEEKQRRKQALQVRAVCSLNPLLCLRRVVPAGRLCAL